MSRRSVLAAGAVTAVGLAAGCTTEAAEKEPAHQTGVVSAPEDRVVLTAWDVTRSPGDLLHALGTRISQIHAGGTAGVLLAAGASLFDTRFGLAPHRPSLLTAMPGFANDALDAASCHGDLLLQIGGADPAGIAAVADDLLAVAGDGATERWRIEGFRAENTTTASGLPSTRNLFGFREGAGNPDPRDAELMDRLVWADDDEPAWAVGGTYQVVRLIRFATQLWDREPVPVQEEVLGRHRSDGTPLGGGAEDAAFDYAADPDGAVTPLEAHIRRANPRTAESAGHRILRRGFSYRDGDDAGLIFVCFQRDPENGFAAAQRRLTGEALDRYVLPFGGGYFFAPPSIDALTSLVTG